MSPLILFIAICVVPSGHLEKLTYRDVTSEMAILQQTNNDTMQELQFLRKNLAASQAASDRLYGDFVFVKNKYHDVRDERDELLIRLERLESQFHAQMLSTNNTLVELQVFIQTFVETASYYVHVVLIIVSTLVALSALYVSSIYIVRLMNNIYSSFSWSYIFSYPFLAVYYAARFVCSTAAGVLRRALVDPRANAGMHEYIELEALREGSKLNPVIAYPEFQADVQIFISGKWKTIANASAMNINLVGPILLTCKHVLPYGEDVRFYNYGRPDSKPLIVAYKDFSFVDDTDMAYCKVAASVLSTLMLKTAKRPSSLDVDLPTTASLSGGGYVSVGVLLRNTDVFGGLYYEGSSISGFSGAPYTNHRTMYGMHKGSNSIGVGYDYFMIDSFIRRNEKVREESSEDVVVEEILKTFRRTGKKFRVYKSHVEYRGKYYDLENTEIDIPQDFWDAMNQVNSKGEPIILESAQFSFNDTETVPDCVAPIVQEEQKPTVEDIVDVSDEEPTPSVFPIVVGPGKQSPAGIVPRPPIPRRPLGSSGSCPIPAQAGTQIQINLDGHQQTPVQQRDPLLYMLDMQTVLISLRKDSEHIKQTLRLIARSKRLSAGRLRYLLKTRYPTT
nr:MAG: RNA-dependent RNA polymerase [Riboviria sp.]